MVQIGLSPSLPFLETARLKGSDSPVAYSVAYICPSVKVKGLSELK